MVIVTPLIKALERQNLMDLLQIAHLKMALKVILIQIIQEQAKVIRLDLLLVIRMAPVLLSKMEVVIAKGTPIVKVLRRGLPKEYLNPILRSISISAPRNGSSTVMKFYFHDWTMVGVRDSTCQPSM